MELGTVSAVLVLLSLDSRDFKIREYDERSTESLCIFLVLLQYHCDILLISFQSKNSKYIPSVQKVHFTLNSDICSVVYSIPTRILNFCLLAPSKYYKRSESLLIMLVSGGDGVARVGAPHHPGVPPADRHQLLHQLLHLRRQAGTM